jgi:hypothetical protein
MASLYGHIAALLIDETVDETLQDISIEPKDEVTDVITRGTADSMEPVGPLTVDITAGVQYPRTGGPVDYMDLMENRKVFRVAWVDCDGKRGAAKNCRVLSAPRNDPMKGERKQDLKIHGYLVSRPA